MNFHSNGGAAVFPVVLKIQQSLGQCIQVREVVRGENLALHDGDVDLDLIQPTGMDGRVHENQRRVAILQASGEIRASAPDCVPGKTVGGCPLPDAVVP